MAPISKFVISFAVFALIVFAFLAFDIPYSDTVDDFATCVAAGNPVMESYPRQCRDRNGNLFIEEIKKPNPEDMVRVSLPVANSVVESPITIKGEARGMWFFEASFPIEIISADGTVIGQGIAQAKEDWMTENFVPFEALIAFKTNATTTGVIRLKKDNPSGDPINDAYLDVPVKFGI